MKVITDTEELKGFCERAKSFDYVTVDTEFLREKTYYAQLCLIQAATTNEAVIIDPLAEGIDLASFFELMQHEATVKVFHAARQDLEIFVHLSGEIPKPLFDTQIAAMVFGFGDQVGYEPLVRDLTGHQVDKGSRFTDWSRRPLSDKQLTYALGDVTHLRDVYEALRKRLDETGRSPWVEEELQQLYDIELYRTEPTEAWKRLKMRNVRPKELGPLMKIAEWREREAQQRNVPRARIIKDDVIFEVGRARPGSVKELGALRSVPQGFERSAMAKGLLEAVAEGIAIPHEELPKLATRSREQAPPDVVDLLRVLLKRQCEKHEVAPKLLASSSDLDALALSDQADIPALKGWRHEVFGEMALRLKNGELALSLDGRRVKLVDHQTD
ncbi:ribonuclease D [Parvularcula sp. ZS-1/3]|uniref:Ribonuclease D n=1 Tax=Parvularcula mediterranea TaxID=2732508 RepID=A0A7Y3RLL4_9PROT|nr:ribonuclease D [Parvularcula mediterranea]NNU16352.1 ribonuclease D [Parvularcula mediterranea]